MHDLLEIQGIYWYVITHTNIFLMLVFDISVITICKQTLIYAKELNTEDWLKMTPSASATHMESRVDPFEPCQVLVGPDDDGMICVCDNSCLDLPTMLVCSNWRLHT